MKTQNTKKKVPKKESPYRDGQTFGRPSEYDPAYIGKVKEYLAGCKDSYDANKLKVNLPTVEGFALYVGIGKTTLYVWKDLHDDFRGALEEIEKEQHKRLLNSGLSGEYNSTIAKLVLSSNHGYAEKSETRHSGGIRLEDLTD